MATSKSPRSAGRSNLGEVLVAQGVLDENQLEQAVARQRESGKGLAPTIVELGLATDDQVVAAVATHEQMRFVDLNREEPDHNALTLIDGTLARKHLAVPVDFVGDLLLVAMANPRSADATREIELVTGMKVQTAYATRRAVDATISRLYDPAREKPETSSPPPEPSTDIGEPASAQDPQRVGTRLGVDDDELPVDIHELLEQVQVRGGSDLHLTAGVPPTIRIHGDLVQMEEHPVLKPIVLQKIIYGILSQKQRERLESDLDLDFSYSVPDVSRFRTNVFIQRGAIGAVFRIIPFNVKSIDELGLPNQSREFARLPRGLVLVTGPTGSGKSTSLAAIIDIINNERPVHIMTVEDPIEFLHEHKKAIVNQREVGEDVRGFAQALKHVLRQDPDVILVGEMRDLETTSLAITAAETGHLVFGTLHTQDAPQTIDRVIDQFPPHQQQQIRVQLAGSLQAVLSQQLLQTADGRGRAVACEILIATPAVRNLIREGKTHQIYSSMQAGAQFGMQTMDAHLAELVRKGTVSQRDAMERCHNAEEFATLVGGAGGGSASGRARVIA